MTTIAWDGKTLAADKQCTYASTPMPVKKLWKIKHRGKPALLGAAGSVKDLMPIVKWLKGKRKKPSISEEADFSIMLIDYKGRVKYMNDSLHWYKIGRNPWTIGSGCNYALGAMLAGASAEQSISIASALDIHTGLGVDTLTL